MNDPLNLNIKLQDVDTTFPLAPEADYPLQVVTSSIGPNYDKTGMEWDLAYGLTQEVQSVDGGKTLKVGTKLFPDWPLQLQPRADGKGGDVWSGSAAERSLCATVDAIFGTTKANRPNFDQGLIAAAIGKMVIGHVVIDTDKNGIQRNKVTRLKKAA